MDKRNIRIQKLQNKMKEKNLDYYLIPTSDFHNSEYVGEYFQVREYYSGFTGSNGSLLISEEAAFLWTDGRYFVQADKELAGSGIKLMKMGEKGVPAIADFLAEKTEKLILGFDGRVLSAAYVEKIVKKKKNITIAAEEDYAGNLWEDRPTLSCQKAYELPLEYAGETVSKKLQKVREEMKKQQADFLFISKLDDIMWLYNIRGEDVSCNPVALCFALVTEKEAFLFIQNQAVDEKLSSYLEVEQIQTFPYESVYEYLEKSVSGIGIAPASDTNYRAYRILMNQNRLVDASVNDSPIPLLKAVKNKKEIANIKEYFLLDSVCVCKFMYWLKTTTEKLDELKVAKYLDDLRSTVKDFKGLSFPTISAYGENAAMMHYEACEDSYAGIEKKGFLLVDSGGQYLGATTDVTRTFAMGCLSREEMRFFTLVAMGMLRLQNAVFLEGCTGRNLDILARLPLWEQGIDYKCGTGHGVGCFLNVHEGPHSIRWRYDKDAEETILKPGMTVTDEPGVYFAGHFGIRTENTLLVVDKEENEDGHFLCFESLTFVPIDLDAIDLSVMEKKDIRLLNEYHRNVNEKIAPFLTKEEQMWLADATREI